MRQDSTEVSAGLVPDSDTREMIVLGPDQIYRIDSKNAGLVSAEARLLSCRRFQLCLGCYQAHHEHDKISTKIHVPFPATPLKKSAERFGNRSASKSGNQDR
jgi:hypothetical protein